MKLLISVFLVLGTGASAAWHLDRDNTMVPAEPEIGDAMAIVLGGNGTATQAIQVCSGVYLATAHGALDDPVKAKAVGRSYRPPGQFAMRLIAYPMIRENMTQALDVEDYISPRLRNPSLWNWGNHWSDYVFIRVDEPIRPQSFVRPLEITPELLIEYRDEFEVYLYRGDTKYIRSENGGLEQEEVNGVPRPVARVTNDDTQALSELFQVPQKVEQACDILGVDNDVEAFVAHNCPTEQGVSGSAYTWRLDGVPYLVGLNTMGSNSNISSSIHAGGSTMLTSSAFCADYERACGQPCAQLNGIFE